MTPTSLNDEYRIAVLMTCHNRRLKTLKCLDAVKAQEQLGNIHLAIFLVDDGCTDGTNEAVRSTYPDVTILLGNGNLYWCGGMRMAWAEAIRRNYDFYLWLNDDTYIFPTTIRKMVDTSKRLSDSEDVPVILTGATCRPSTEICTYGGVEFNGFLNKEAFSKLNPSNRPQRCDTVNGNCTLISRNVVKRVGNLSAAFTHGIGDFDYGLRAKKQHIQCWLEAGFIGECEDNPSKGSWLDTDLSVNERIHAMKLPTGLPPVREWMIFTWRHAGWLWPICWLRSITRALFPKLKLRNY